MENSIAPSNIVGLAEIATMSKRDNSTANNWSVRFPDFPKPIAYLKSGRLWNKTQIELWLSKHLARLDEWRYVHWKKKRKSESTSH